MVKEGKIDMWTIWNKKDDINGVSAERYLSRHKHLQKEETIFLKWANNRVIWVMGKNILASNYGIDASLDNEAFIAEYERVLAEPSEAEATETGEVTL
jgi:hypothetical protein